LRNEFAFEGEGNSLLCLYSIRVLSTIIASTPKNPFQIVEDFQGHDDESLICIIATRGTNLGLYEIGKNRRKKRD